MGSGSLSRRRVADNDGLSATVKRIIRRLEGLDQVRLGYARKRSAEKLISGERLYNKKGSKTFRIVKFS